MKNLIINRFLFSALVTLMMTAVVFLGGCSSSKQSEQASEKITKVAYQNNLNSEGFQAKLINEEIVIDNPAPGGLLGYYTPKDSVTQFVKEIKNPNGSKVTIHRTTQVTTTQNNTQAVKTDSTVKEKSKTEQETEVEGFWDTFKWYLIIGFLIIIAAMWWTKKIWL